MNVPLSDLTKVYPCGQEIGVDGRERLRTSTTPAPDVACVTQLQPQPLAPLENRMLDAFARQSRLAPGWLRDQYPHLYPDTDNPKESKCYPNEVYKRQMVNDFEVLQAVKRCKAP